MHGYLVVLILYNAIVHHRYSVPLNLTLSAIVACPLIKIPLLVTSIDALQALPKTTKVTENYSSTGKQFQQ